MKYLITGGAGFLGSNLAAEVLKRKEKLVIYDNLSRMGSEKNLEWLKTQGEFEFLKETTADFKSLTEILKNFQPDVIFHLAGQVAMTTSIFDPRKDFETNALGSFNVLDAVRLYAPNAAVIYSSTNKVYGDLEYLNYKETNTRYELTDFPKGLPESVSLDFASPYGCSKGSADQYMHDFYKTFKVKTVVFRHSSMYGGRQFSTFDQGWLGWFCEQAVLSKLGKLSKPFTISGNGKQVRDVLHSQDMVALYFKAAENISSIAGEVFNIGGGQENSLSLIELFSILEKQLEVKLSFTQLPTRQSDQKVFVADIAKAKRLIGWEPKVLAKEGIRQMLEWVKSINNE
jgi:CDP-paratose 2-epimerase